MSELRSSRFARSTKHSVAPTSELLSNKQAHFDHFVKRHIADIKFIEDYDPNAPSKPRKHNDTVLDLSHYPSYTKFKVPL